MPQPALSPNQYIMLMTSARFRDPAVGTSWRLSAQRLARVRLHGAYLHVTTIFNNSNDA